MIANIFLNRSNENIISKELREYLREIEYTNLLRRLNMITDDNLLKAKVEFKKSHIGK